MRTRLITRGGQLLAALAAIACAASCSPGSLPGSPSPITSAGGGGRYDGTITYRRTAGAFTLDESLQPMNLSVVLAPSVNDQFSANFTTAGGSRGQLQGTVNGALNNGTFTATLLVTVPANTPVAGGGNGALSTRAVVACEGRGEVTGTFNGPTVTWSVGAITYTNCSGLVTNSQATATATSPIPQVETARANVVITVFPSTTIRRGTCEGGLNGYPFEVEVAETNGISLTINDTVIVEEEKNGQKTTSREENPMRSLAGGEKRRYVACGAAPGSYQVFFTGRDNNNNDIKFASPRITFVP